MDEPIEGLLEQAPRPARRRRPNVMRYAGLAALVACVVATAFKALPA